MGFWSDLFGGGSDKKTSATKTQVKQASDQIAGLVENKDLLQDKAPVQVNEKFADFLERNKRADGSYNSAAQAIIDHYDDGRSNYQVAMEQVKNMPGGKEAFKKTFPNPLVKGAQAIGDYIQGGGILGIIPNLLGNVNKKMSGIFSNEKAPTDMGTRMSSMDQADLDALSGPGMLDISGPGTPATEFDNEADALAAYNAENPNFPALNTGIANPALINANSLLNFNDLLNLNSDVVDAQSIANAYKALQDNQGFDVQDNQLQYNQPLFGGNLEFGVGPDNAGITFSKTWGA